MGFIFTIQSNCCTVLSTSYDFLPSYMNFPNLSQWTSSFEPTYIQGSITFSESSGLILGVVEIKYGQDFIFPVFTVFEKLKQKAPFKVLEGSTSNNYKTNFWKKMSRETLSVLTPLS